MAEAAQDIQVVISDEDTTVEVDPRTGTIMEHQPDGSVVVQLDAHRLGKDGKDEERWFRNLIDDLDISKQGAIAQELCDGIKADDQSRQGSLSNAANGLKLLGLEVKEPEAEAGNDGVVSSVTNPLLLEACIKSWANAQAELLPAAGPAKVEVDTSENTETDELSEKLGQHFNHYLTKTATEYYPETSHMLLWGPIFKGSGFKKIYRCPLRRRPVSEAVDAKDLIMSDTTKDFASCGRITHEISMRPSMFKRMVMIKAYRDIGDVMPNPQASEPDEKIAAIQGTQALPSRPEDKPYTIWETQCELDLDEFIPATSEFKGKKIPLPYVVSIDKDTEQLLAIRRDWDREDEQCHRLRMYVRYLYVPGPGAYGTGLLNMLGNASAALTGAWRMALDTGMFANFPGGLIAKQGNRQDTSNVQPAPGEFQPVETGNLPIQDAVMAFPYKDVTPGLMALIDKILMQSKGVSNAAEIPVGDGLKDIPVGTMIAQIEEATKIMAAVHKGWHTAQSEEFELLIELFRRNPEDFYRDNKEAKNYWDETKLIAALDNKSIIPVSDPNVPSHLHRLMKVLALIQLKEIFPQLRPDRILRRALAVLHEDYDDLVDPNYQPQAQMDPKVISAVTTAQAKQADTQAKLVKTSSDIQQNQLQTAQKAAEMASEERQREMDITKELIIHASDEKKLQVAEERNHVMAQAKLVGDEQHRAHERRMDEHNAAMEQEKLALEKQQAGVAAVDSAHQRNMDLASHALEKSEAAHNAAVDVHEALNPSKPAAAAKSPSKPKPKKK